MFFGFWDNDFGFNCCKLDREPPAYNPSPKPFPVMALYSSADSYEDPAPGPPRDRRIEPPCIMIFRPFICNVRMYYKERK